MGEHDVPRYEDAPATVGELRRRLAELGDPWHVDPDLPDDAPLPEPPRGATAPEADEALAAARSVGDLGVLLEMSPPMNHDLRQRWVEVGLLSGESA